MTPFQKAKRRKLFYSWKLFEVVPVAAMLVFMLVNPSAMTRLNKQLAFINPFVKQTFVFEIHDNGRKNVDVAEKENSRTAELTMADTISDSTASKAQEDKNMVESIVENKETAAPTINLKSTSETDDPALCSSVKPLSISSAEKKEVRAEKQIPTNRKKQYYIIGGCFRIIENAEKFRNDLIADGYNASIIGLNSNGLNMVSIFSDPDISKVSGELVLIKEKTEPNAWILHK